VSDQNSSETQDKSDEGGRRSFLSRSSSWTMLAGLAGSYGAFAFIAGRFLYPSRPTPRDWLYVIETRKLKLGESILYRGPSGETINITRQRQNGDAEDFIALSSTCPHLGCQVHWEAADNRFFCPCHNGTFDADGQGTGGPPGEAGLTLPHYPLRIERNLLYIEVPRPALGDAGTRGEIIERVEGIHGSGHDPCLSSLPCGKKVRKV
jgi:nitrite reductase/ring-hydroxylating ferredoxin subunit